MSKYKLIKRSLNSAPSLIATSATEYQMMQIMFDIGMSEKKKGAYVFWVNSRVLKCECQNGDLLTLKMIE